MHQVPQEFMGGRGLELPGMNGGVIEAHEDLSVQRFIGCDTMIEGDDIRGADVPKPAVIELPHLGGADEVDAQLPRLQAEFVGQEGRGHPAEGSDIDLPSTLAIPDDEFPLHSGSVRR